jgi:phosphomannomutase
MTLIKSISGIRGTIGGSVGENLTPLDIVKFTAAFGFWLKNKNNQASIVIGRDARVSGQMLNQLVTGTLMGLGFDVIDLGLSTTPTVELMVTEHRASGGIILTASHNPGQWNALKLLNSEGEFISAEDGQAVLEIADKESFSFASVDKLGSVSHKATAIYDHIAMVLDLDLVNPNIIREKEFKIVVDAVNSTGGIAIPNLLSALGVDKVIELYCEPNGDFPHNPEPLAENLQDIAELVVRKKADLGIVVDPDVDRLCFINEDGTMFGEEYTLVAIADYILSKKKGNTVSNLSSTKALSDVTVKHGGKYTASAVGEVNVVTQMKESNAIIGGEGNGGVIYPESHYGRDALVGVGLFLTHLAEQGLSMTELRKSYPAYEMSKNKIQLEAGMNLDSIFEQVESKFSERKLNKVDGLKIEYSDGWVHLRRSNTEPIIRVYSEGPTKLQADKYANEIIDFVQSII